MTEDQLKLSNTLEGAAEMAVVVTTAIPSRTPLVGIVRIQLDTGIYRRQAYTSWSRRTFKIEPADYTEPNNATNGNEVFIPCLDEEAAAEDKARREQEKRLAEIKARAEAATLGPWEVRYENPPCSNLPDPMYFDDEEKFKKAEAKALEMYEESLSADEIGPLSAREIIDLWEYGYPYPHLGVKKPDAEFIAHARVDIPYLLRLLDARRRVKEL